jgi:hypothetical protein
MAKIIWTIEHYNFGGNDEDTGWWFQRVTIGLKDGKPYTVLDKKRLAKFDCGTSTDIQVEILTLDDAIKRDEFRMLNQEWNMDAVGSLRQR